MESNKGSRVAAFVAVVLLVGAIVYLTIEMGKNSRLESSLNMEKLTSETLLSEKLSLQKEIGAFKESIRSLEGKNEDLDRVIKSTEKKLEEEEKELGRMKKQASSAVQLKRQYQELQKIKENLEQEVNRYNSSLSELKKANETMNNEVATLKQQNKDLKDELNRVQLASLNDVLVEPVKKNNMLTVKASRTKKIVVHADIPVENAGESMTLKIITPQGKELPVKESELTIKKEDTTSKEQPFYASNSSISPGLAYKSVEIGYRPKGKLAPGVYRISLMNNGKSIGSLQVRLR